jgi:adenine phosphoribosyltransferase
VTSTDGAWLSDHIRDIPDFPKPGVVFKDITPMLANADAFRASIDGIAGHFEGRRRIDKVLGIEARGFIVAAPVAYQFRAGFVPVRKAGKLPWEIERQEYELEYGTDLLEIHRDAIQPGERVLVIDDVLATGGTAAATVRLVEKLGGVVVGLGFIIELTFLNGRAKVADHEVTALIQY